MCRQDCRFTLYITQPKAWIYKRSAEYRSIQINVFLSVVKYQTNLQSEVDYSSCNTLYRTIGHQAVYTSLWLTVSLGISFFNVCCWKKWLVHVRIHNPVWKFLIDVVISLDVQALVLISCLEHFYNPAATSGKQWHSRENFVQNQCKIQERDNCHKVNKLNRKR